MITNFARTIAFALLAFSFSSEFSVRGQNTGLGDHCTSTAIATLVNGFVVNVEVIDSGSGYSQAETIGASAFQGCAALQNVIVNESLTTIF
jgi:hypothetical protein